MSIAMIILTTLIAVMMTLAIIVVIRTMLFARPQKDEQPVEPIKVNAEIVAEKLAAGIRCRTISNSDPAQVDRQAFRQLHNVIEKSFPHVHGSLEKHETGTDSLVYIWKGSEEPLRPVVFMGHQDVVMVDNATLKDWQHEPFSGDIAERYVWGGALWIARARYLASSRRSNSWLSVDSNQNGRSCWSLGMTRK